ncbi:hypothetical protein WMY93_007548 [Mugilogobius chulae]|uniref:Uncharacterized protein n=1 Tax=Mugilogobius chulae TaxID=88201 RepID=A0AAW0PGP4_9GOBI
MTPAEALVSSTLPRASVKGFGGYQIRDQVSLLTVSHLDKKAVKARQQVPGALSPGTTLPQRAITRRIPQSPASTSDPGGGYDLPHHQLQRGTPGLPAADPLSDEALRRQSVNLQREGLKYYKLVPCDILQVVKQTSEDDKDKDQESWFEPKANSFKTFAETAHAWIQETILRTSEVVIYSQEVQPSDSISNASCSQRSATSSRHSSRASATSSTRMKAEIERATLLIKASSLKQKQALEEKEAKLKREKEELEMQTALAENEAKIKILSDYEERDSKSSVSDGMNAYAESRRVKSLPLPVSYRVNTIHHQNRAFEHGVEDKTDNDKDRLYYMEQYTSGQPRELIRSCLHMDPTRGYKEAKRLLEEHFGNAYKISVAYINKALDWPTIKSDDGEALHAFGLFLTGCRNAMNDVEFMEELDNTANMRAIIAKLPYKLRERWRTYACGVHEWDQRRAKFEDLVDFVNKQAKEALHPLFGDIKDGAAKGQAKSQTDERLQKRFSSRKAFTTAATITSFQDANPKAKNKVGDTQVCAFSKPCLFCQGAEHVMEQCKKMKKSLHKEKIDFLRAKVTSYSATHKAKTKEVEPEVESSGTGEKTSESVVNGFVGMKTPAHGTEDTEHILSIVPVQVKAKQGQKITQTHAFLDPGSTACFCTEELMQELSLTGRNTNILLKTMGEEKVVSSHIVSGLEVSSLDNNDFFELPDMYSHSNIPASVENIPSPEYVSKWPYLQQVSIPKIDAKIGLLIGTNAPKAIEPWQVIASENGGPYAVKTRLGWTVSEPLQGNTSESATSGLIQVSANRISVSRLDELLSQQFKTDFPECGKDETKDMSREDLQFLDIATQSSTLVDGHYSIALPLRSKDVQMPNNRKVAEKLL